MAQYISKNGDVAFRKVNVAASAEPRFENFAFVGQEINYPDQMVVLEVLRQDGKTELIYEGPRITAAWRLDGPDRIQIQQNVPRERLWLRNRDSAMILYKVPVQLPQRDMLVTMQVPCGTHNMELCADRYFERIYELNRV